MKSVFDTQRIYKDTARRMVSGVCAGVARYFGQEPWLVRGLAIAAFLFVPVAVALAYVLGVVLLPSRNY